MSATPQTESLVQHSGALLSFLPVPSPAKVGVGSTSKGSARGDTSQNLCSGVITGGYIRLLQDGGSPAGLFTRRSSGSTMTTFSLPTPTGASYPRPPDMSIELSPSNYHLGSAAAILGNGVRFPLSTPQIISAPYALSLSNAVGHGRSGETARSPSAADMRSAHAFAMVDARNASMGGLPIHVGLGSLAQTPVDGSLLPPAAASVSAGNVYGWGRSMGALVSPSSSPSASVSRYACTAAAGHAIGGQPIAGTPPFGAALPDFPFPSPANVHRPSARSIDALKATVVYSTAQSPSPAAASAFQATAGTHFDPVADLALSIASHHSADAHEVGSPFASPEVNRMRIATVLDQEALGSGISPPSAQNGSSPMFPRNAARQQTFDPESSGSVPAAPIVLGSAAFHEPSFLPTQRQETDGPGNNSTTIAAFRPNGSTSGTGGRFRQGGWADASDSENCHSLPNRLHPSLAGDARSNFARSNFHPSAAACDGANVAIFAMGSACGGGEIAAESLGGDPLGGMAFVRAGERDRCESEGTCVFDECDGEGGTGGCPIAPIIGEGPAVCVQVPPTQSSAGKGVVDTVQCVKTLPTQNDVFKFREATASDVHGIISLREGLDMTNATSFVWGEKEMKERIETRAPLVLVSTTVDAREGSPTFGEEIVVGCSGIDLGGMEKDFPILSIGSRLLRGPANERVAPQERYVFPKDYCMCRGLLIHKDFQGAGLGSRLHKGRLKLLAQIAPHTRAVILSARGSTIEETLSAIAPHLTAAPARVPDASLGSSQQIHGPDRSLVTPEFSKDMLFEFTFFTSKGIVHMVHGREGNGWRFVGVDEEDGGPVWLTSVSLPCITSTYDMSITLNPFADAPL